MDSIPQFLRAMFEGSSLAASRSTLVVLAPSGKILWVNAAWCEFARANGGDEVLTKFGPGVSYFEGIAEPLRSFYEGAFADALRTGEPFEHDYECSTEDAFRILHLRLLPFGSEGVLLEHSLLVEHPHGGQGAEEVEARYRDPRGILVQCSHCRRVRQPDGQSWDWVREWVRTPARDVSHGICKTCIVYYWGTKLRHRR